MEGHNQNQREDHREEVKSRYSEPFNDSPYQYKNDIDHTRNSRYDKSLNANASQSRERFPESGTNRDQRGLPSEPADRTPGAFDDRIREIISDRMATDPSLDSRDINVIVR